MDVEILLLNEWGLGKLENWPKSAYLFWSFDELQTAWLQVELIVDQNAKLLLLYKAPTHLRQPGLVVISCPQDFLHNSIFSGEVTQKAEQG